jgi:DNA-binding transcriptional LysR family regulator
MANTAGLEAIATFVSVIEAGGFAAASRKTGVARSTVSARVSELESRLGISLIKRTTRRLQLTAAGQEYFETARRSLEQIQAAERALKGHESEARGRLRIAAATNMGEGPIGDAIADFLIAYPAIEIELDLGQRRVDLIGERFDLALRLGELDDASSLVGRPLGNISRQLMASPDYALAHPITHPRQIDPRTVIGFAGEHGVELIHESGERYVLDCRGRIQANRMTAIRHQAKRGMGWALLPTALTMDSTDPSRLVVALPAWKTARFPVHVVYARQYALPHRARLFIDFMVEALKPRM